MSDVESGVAKLAVGYISIDVVLGDLLVARQAAAGLVHRLDHQESPTGLKRRIDVRQHRFVRCHFVIRIVNKDGVELPCGEMRVVRRAEHDVDRDVFPRRTLSQLRECCVADINRHCAATWRDSASDADREEAVTSSNIGNDCPWLRLQRRQKIVDAVEAFEFRIRLLRSGRDPQNGREDNGD